MNDTRESDEGYRINLRALEQAKPGSDLYGVLEKTAFHISLLTKNPDDVKNWLDAHIALAAYAAHNFIFVRQVPLRKIDLSVEGSSDICTITGYLKWQADEQARVFRGFTHFLGNLGERPSPDDFWNFAQDELAKSAAKSFYQSQREA